MRSTMIDLEARRKLAELLRRFSLGRVSNFDFENQTPESTDPVINAIESSIWCFYDDFEEEKMADELTLSSAQKSAIARWIVFLYTDEPYDWPKIPFPGVRPLNHGFISKLLGKEGKEKAFISSGDYDVWPFFARASYMVAKDNPRLLAGQGYNKKSN